MRLAAGAMDAAWGMTPAGLPLEVLVGVAAFAVLALAWCLATRDPRLRRVLGR